MLERLKTIGPGAMVAAAFIGPGTVTTATIAGSGFGYTLLWAVLFSIGATLVLQEMTARLAIAGGRGLGGAAADDAPPRFSSLAVSEIVPSGVPSSWAAATRDFKSSNEP